MIHIFLKFPLFISKKKEYQKIFLENFCFPKDKIELSGEEIGYGCIGQSENYYGFDNNSSSVDFNLPKWMWKEGWLWNETRDYYYKYVGMFPSVITATEDELKIEYLKSIGQ